MQKRDWTRFVTGQRLCVLFGLNVDSGTLVPQKWWTFVKDLSGGPFAASSYNSKPLQQVEKGKLKPGCCRGSSGHKGACWRR